MSYTLEIAQSAQDDLKKLDKPVLKAIRRRLERLVQNADQIQHLPLKGRFSGLYKLRAYGKYRIVYDLQKAERRIIIVRVGKRDEIYDD